MRNIAGLSIYSDIFFLIVKLQWTQNNSELQLRHNKREGNMERARGSKTVKSLSEYV
jgi:hypothetical protein